MANVALLGGNEEHRLLLRGLLHLHHHHVLFEGRRPEELLQLPSTPGPDLVILDLDSETGEWTRSLTPVRERFPRIQTILVIPRRTPGLEAQAEGAGAGAVLVRPFLLQDLLGAVERLVPSVGGNRVAGDPEPP